MGMLVSWISSALVHHGIIHFLFSKTLKRAPRKYEYMVLGDDVATIGAVMPSYKTLMSSLGMELNDNKSTSSDFYMEFAKRLYRRSYKEVNMAGGIAKVREVQDVTGLPVSLLTTFERPERESSDAIYQLLKTASSRGYSTSQILDGLMAYYDAHGQTRNLTNSLLAVQIICVGSSLINDTDLRTEYYHCLSKPFVLVRLKHGGERIFTCYTPLQEVEINQFLMGAFLREWNKGVYLPEPKSEAFMNPLFRFAVNKNLKSTNENLYDYTMEFLTGDVTTNVGSVDWLKPLFQRGVLFSDLSTALRLYERTLNPRKRNRKSLVTAAIISDYGRYRREQNILALPTLSQDQAINLEFRHVPTNELQYLDIYQEIGNMRRKMFYEYLDEDCGPGPFNL
jgi:hypothetical protein